MPQGQTPLLDGNLKNLFYPPEPYTYFQRATNLPFATGSTLVKAAWAADASMLAYAHCGSRAMSDVELAEHFGRAGLVYAKIGDWKGSGTQAVFASCEQFAILAFRGTEFDDPGDLLIDALLIPALEGPLSLHPALVHRGFRNALNSVWDELAAAVAGFRAGHPQAEICLTGHSLGAALATLTYERLGETDANLSLYTFGCPRVGNEVFRDRAITHKGLGVHRFVNDEDTVTHVPANITLYVHVPTESGRFDAQGKLGKGDDTARADFSAFITPLTEWRGKLAKIDVSSRDAFLASVAAPGGLLDHSPARYCFRLWDCVT